MFSATIAAVDVGEELCEPEPAERGTIQEVNGTAKPIKRKDRTAEKRQPIPSGLAGTAPLRRAFRFGFPRCLFSWRVLVAAAHQRRRSRIKDKHTPRLQIAFESTI